MDILYPQGPEGIYQEMYDVFINLISSENIVSGCEIKSFPYYKDKDYSVIVFKSKTGEVSGHIMSYVDSFRSAAIKYLDGNNSEYGFYFDMTSASFYNNSESTVQFFKVYFPHTTFPCAGTQIISDDEDLEDVRNFCKSIIIANKKLQDKEKQ